MEKKQVSPILILLIFLFLIVGQAVSQNGTECDYKRPHEADTWVFGNQSRILFNIEPTQSNPTPNTYSLPNGSASISDEDGDLLFFISWIMGII